MIMNKILVRLYVPTIEKQYDIWLPINKKIGNIIILLIKALTDLDGDSYKINANNFPVLYDKYTSTPYDVHLTVKESTIRNGSELILI